MDDTFQRKLLRLKEVDLQLARLLDQHEQYETELQKLDRRKFRTQDEESRLKVIKFAKARGKEQMASIVSKYDIAA